MERQVVPSSGAKAVLATLEAQMFSAIAEKLVTSLGLTSECAMQIAKIRPEAPYTTDLAVKHTGRDKRSLERYRASGLLKMEEPKSERGKRQPCIYLGKALIRLILHLSKQTVTLDEVLKVLSPEADRDQEAAGGSAEEVSVGSRKGSKFSTGPVWLIEVMSPKLVSQLLRMDEDYVGLAVSRKLLLPEERGITWRSLVRFLSDVNASPVYALRIVETTEDEYEERTYYKRMNQIGYQVGDSEDAIILDGTTDSKGKVTFGQTVPFARVQRSIVSFRIPGAPLSIPKLSEHFDEEGSQLRLSLWHDVLDLKRLSG